MAAKEIYDVKECLTNGIKKIEAETGTDKYGNEHYWVGYEMRKIGTYGFYTMKEAVERAKEIRDRKVQILQRKIDKLNEINFDDDEQE